MPSCSANMNILIEQKKGKSHLIDWQWPCYCCQKHCFQTLPTCPFRSMRSKKLIWRKASIFSGGFVVVVAVMVENVENMAVLNVIQSVWKLWPSYLIVNIWFSDSSQQCFVLTIVSGHPSFAASCLGSSSLTQSFSTTLLCCCVVAAQRPM